MATRWKITVEYDGASFFGWQRQADRPSVQEAVERALAHLAGPEDHAAHQLRQQEAPPAPGVYDPPIVLHCGGRTDTGVHATGQVAHFDLAKPIRADKLRDALNFYLRPHPVAIIDCTAVDNNFHARFSAVKRAYRYRILDRRSPSPLRARHSWHIPYPLNLEPMQEAANLLLGTHDFTSFRASECQGKSPIKTIDLFEISRRDDEIILMVEARSFLHHQVRNFTGTLALIGKGQWLPSRIPAILAAKDRTIAGPTAPACGLCLTRIDYA